jgi:hypothetical protein
MKKIIGRNHYKDHIIRRMPLSDKREPAEQMRDAHEILEEMRICPGCKDHMPCGCDGFRFGRKKKGVNNT